MSTKRQPSKQRRQTQNQKQRAALEARAAAAAAAAPGRQRRAAVESSSTEPVAARVGALAVPGRQRPPGEPIRTGRGRASPVGHRAALSALLAAIAAAVVGLVPVPGARRPQRRRPSRSRTCARRRVVAQRPGGASPTHPDATADELAASVDDWMPGGTEPYIQAFWPISLAVVPAGHRHRAWASGPCRGARRPRSSTARCTSRCSAPCSPSQLLLVFLPAVISLAVAAFQVRKAEVAAAPGGRARGRRHRRRRRRRGRIEVDEVDEVDERRRGRARSTSPTRSTSVR